MALNPGEQPSGGWVIDADGRQSISIQGGTGGGGGGGAGGTEYAEGTVNAAPTGGVILWKDVGNALVAVSAAKPLPVSGPLTDAQLRAAALPVSGTFWQATQPVSGTVSVGNFPATQPVSGTVTANVGTGTQPVSGTVALDATSLTALETISVANFPATQPVSGSVGVTGALPAGANNIGGVDVASLPALPAGTNQIGTTLGPALAKGTQGATGYAVQELKDAGRQQVMLSWLEVAGTANAESALTNFTAATRNATALTAASSYTVSAGKTLRIQEIHTYVKATSTVNNLCFFRLRQAASGIANSSPIIWSTVQALELATVAANAVEVQEYVIPDGLEVPAGQQIAFTWLSTANTCTLGFVLVGFEY